MRKMKDWNWRLIGLVVLVVAGIALLASIFFKVGESWNQYQQPIEVITNSQGWNPDPYGIRGGQGQNNGWNSDPYGIRSNQSVEVADDSGVNLTWLWKSGKIALLTIVVIFVSKLLSAARMQKMGTADGFAVWLGACPHAIFGPSPRPSPLLWASSLAAAIFAALLIFFFWSDILVICLIPVAIIVAILFWAGKGALLGEALEGIFTGVIIKKIIKDPTKSAEEAKQGALAKLYQELYDNDEVAKPEREETIKKEIAILRGEKL